MKTAELKVLPVTVLKPAEYNPRKKLKPGDKEYEKIKNSIEEFGFADPLVVNADMTIIGGHQRLTVAMDLGFTEVPCAVVDIDKTREKALNIALNKITGAWDENLLADLLKDIQESDFDLGKTGFDPPEIETLFNKVHSKDVQEDDFDVDEELKQPIFSRLGDLWHLGKHRVICGDSTGEEVYTRLMDGQKANLVLTDPPYNVDVEETAGKIMNDNMADEDFYNFLLSAYRCMHANLADDGSIYVWHADTEGTSVRHSRMPASTCPGAVSGRRTLWCWDAVRSNGFMNPACSAGSRPESISGTPTASRRLYGNMTSRAPARIIPR